MIEAPQCDALQIAGLGTPAAWYREMIDTQASGYAAAGLTLASVFPNADENNVDALLPMIEESGCRVVINRALCVAPSDIAALAALKPDVQFVIVNHSSPTYLWAETNGACRQEMYLALSLAMANVHYATPHEGAAEVLLGCLWWPNWVAEQSPITPRQSPIDRPWRICLISNLRVLKALGVQIMGVAHALEQGLDAQLILCLTKPERPDLVGQVQATINSLPALAGRVGQAPWGGRAQYLELLAQMDIGLQCSPSESENLVALEHMLTGAPVVCSRALRYAPLECLPRNADCPVSISYCLQDLTVDYQRHSATVLTAARDYTERTREQFVAVLNEVTR